MAFFKKRDNKFGGKKFGGKSFGDEKPTMHRAVCDECAQECEVPFKPSGEKPVFCRSCFKKNGGGGSDSGERNFGPRSSGARSFGSRDSERPMHKPGSDKTAQQLEMLNTKLDKILKILSQDL